MQNDFETFPTNKPDKGLEQFDIENDLTVDSSARELEENLYNIQEKIRQTKDVDQEDLADMEIERDKLIKTIARKAKSMMKESEYKDFSMGMQESIAVEFDKVAETIGDVHNSDELLKESVADLINYLKLRVGVFMSDSGIFDEEKIQVVLSEMDGCITSDREEFIGSMMRVLAPIVEAQENNKKAMELAQRKSFLRSSVDKKQFIPIEDTDDILSYGVGGRNGDSIHIHLAPMRTLSTAEQLAFAKKTVPEAFKKLVEVIKADESIKNVTATSYVVAAMPELFKRYGFEIEAMSSDSRDYSWGGEKRPVLRAVMNREKFIKLYNLKNN